MDDNLTRIDKLVKLIMEQPGELLDYSSDVAVPFGLELLGFNVLPKTVKSVSLLPDKHSIEIQWIFGNNCIQGSDVVREWLFKGESDVYHN